MYQFKVKATEYSREGSLTDSYKEFGYGNASDAKCQYDAINREYWIDEETNEQTSVKKYRTELYIAAYKKVDDVNAFFSQFEIVDAD